MIPSVLLRTESRAEAKLFRILQDTSLSDAWTAYHSLNCSEHAYKNWAEIDFLIAGPDAILVLEVKGGRVRCKDGIWIYTDRFGRSRKSAEGPYRQASTAMYALRALLSDRYKLDVVASGRIPFGFGVVFPDIDWDIDTPECPAGITADRLMVAKPAYAAKYVKHLVAYWRGKQAASSTLTDTELRQIRDRLRPDVDIYPPVSQGLGAALTELQHLTEEQYERLELIEQNDRAIVTGGAGTGKTFLLMQYARRCAARGLRVSIVAHSPILAAHLRKGIDDPAISIASIKHLNTELREPADVLLVDEGQDLMNIDALADLSAFVKGGLDDGRWCWFMDDNNQSGVVGRFDLQALAYLQTGLATGKPVKLPLRRNCRNTKEIVRQVQLWTGADIGITEVSGFGNRPQAVAVSPQEAVHELARRVKDCLDGGAEPGDVGIVIEDDTEPAQFRELPAAIRRLLTPLTVASVATNLKGRIVWGSAARFKGLERPIVFVLALEDTNTDGRQGALYVGLTRANYGLCVLASPRRAALLTDAHRRHLPLVQLPGDRPMIALRDKVLNRIKADLFGPGGGEDEVVIGRPYWRYLCGMLFPSSVASVDLEEDDEKDAGSVATGDEQSDPAIALAYDALPSSMGISFFLSGANVLSCRVQGARYEPDPGTADRWVRRPLGTPVCPTQVELEVPRPGVRETHEQHIWEGRARIGAVFRPRANGHLATVSLVNAQNAPGGGPGRQIAQMLFQCQFAVYLPDGSIGEYPTIARYSRHEEDEELAVSYRSRKTYGIGHGCAASWAPATTAIDEIKADPLPRFEVRGLTTSISLPEPAGRCLEIRWLADPSTPRVQLRDAVEAMVDSYREWVNDQEATMATLNETEANPATRMVQRQRTAIARMRKGIATLFGADESVLKAFRIAQEAMLRQFLWVARRKSPKDAGEGDITPMDPWVRLEDSPSWRPFQLAFQLVVLQSLADPDSPDRDVLDLLWFPTGGGKTEAYLALAAFEIALRRVRHGEAGAGTAVLMRYTLRLLTAQQFERAATVVCVLEGMRRERPELGLGERPIRLGLWVGGTTTPNALDRDNEIAPGARQLLERVLDDETPENPFQLRTCPFCGTRIIPTRKSPRRSDYGVLVTSTVFEMKCPDSRCVLHENIPVSMVDEDLYQRPPTFLIGTIDKFARMVWDASSRVFFGGGGTLPPSLIIQDELHLITGPLGTIAGLYEAGIDSVLKSRGLPAKYVAATATIQRAPEQSQTLYARTAAIFPPPGLDAANSFFSKEDGDSPGRTFIGVMGHGLYSSLTSLIQVSAAAAAVPMEIPESQPRARDSYWTQVIYHNSRQELGKTTTMLRDDVRTYLSVLQPDETRRRRFDSMEELSANVKGAQISEVIERLQVEWPNPAVIDAVACTNMIATGVDIGRLGLMIVKGQPKATSEYIQATSRVGRHRRRLPGVVLALYSAARPRDRSHYETFQSYHHSLYRAVEPATATPFSPPARDRALHAGLVLALRHTLAWIEPRDAGKFDARDRDQASIILRFRTRLLAACREDERAELQTHLDTLLTDWARWRDEPGPPLTFSDAPQFHPLLAQFPADGSAARGHWPTLNSMRHVDGEVAFGVRGEVDER